MLNEFLLYVELLTSRVWQRWITHGALATLIGFFVGILVDMKVYIAAISVLVITDMITGIMASLHRGEAFDSRKLLMGLLERFILYFFLFDVTIMLDAIVRDAINYGRDYIAIACCTMIGFYEASSCIENLVSRFPNRLFLQKIGRMLNLLEKSYEDSTVNKITNIINDTKLKQDEN